jgi:hypothetical protein
MHILYSEKLTKLLLLLWLVTIVFAWWFIPPRIDDGIYLIPAVSVLNNLPPGAIINNEIYPMYYIFPTQPFLHGIFLKVFSYFPISIGVEVYRIFNYITVLLLFFFTSRLFSVAFDSHKTRTIAINVCLIVLGVSQFSTQFFVNRPEILGLVFFIIGLKNSIQYIRSPIKSHLQIASFSYGMSIILHANFIISSGAVLIYLVIFIIQIEKKINNIKYILPIFIPLLLFFIWFYVNIEVSFDQLYNRVNDPVQNSWSSFPPAISEMFSVIRGSESRTFAHNVYLALHMLSLTIALIALIPFFFLKINKNSGDFNNVVLFKVLTASIFVLFFFMESYPPNFLLIAYLSIISLVFFFSSGKSISRMQFLNVNSLGASNNKLKILIVILSLGSILSLPTFQLLKIYQSGGSYYNHHKIISTISQTTYGNDHVFIASSQLLPLYLGRINKDFINIGKTDREKIHWYFPIHNDPGVKSRVLALKTIKNDIDLMQGATWGVLKQDLHFSDSRSACLQLIGNFFLKVNGYKVLYEDRGNILFVSDNIKLSTKESCYE